MNLYRIDLRDNHGGYYYHVSALSVGPATKQALAKHKAYAARETVWRRGQPVVETVTLIEKNWR